MEIDLFLNLSIVYCINIKSNKKINFVFGMRRKFVGRRENEFVRI